MNAWWPARRPAASTTAACVNVVHHVSRGVVADAGVLAHEQADGEDVGLAMDAHAIVGVHVGEDELGAGPLLGHRRDEDDEDEHTGDVPEGSELAEPGEPVDGQAVDEAVHDEDGGVDGQHDVLGGQVAAAVGPAGAQQDDHLDQLRQREVHARRARPLRTCTAI